MVLPESKNSWTKTVFYTKKLVQYVKNVSFIAKNQRRIDIFDLDFIWILQFNHKQGKTGEYNTGRSKVLTMYILKRSSWKSYGWLLEAIIYHQQPLAVGHPWLRLISDWPVFYKVNLCETKKQNWNTMV